MKAMNEMKPISNFKNNLYQVAIILLLAYAAYSSAMKDLDRLLQVAGSVQVATTNGLGGLAKVYSATQSLADGPELAQLPATSITESPRVDIIATGGSVSLAGFDRASETEPVNNVFVAAARRHNKLACPLRKQELPKATERNFKWEVVAQLPKDRELLNYELPAERDAAIARVIRRGPRMRTFINKLPVKASKEKWSNVGEFKSLSEVIGLGLKAAGVEEAEIERRVKATDESGHYVFEFKRGASDSERDDLESQR